MIWLRRSIMRVISRYMQPIPPDIAKKWHQRLTIAYVFFSFNAMLCAIYMVEVSNPKHKSLQPGDKAHNIAKKFGYVNPTIVRISGSGVRVENYTVPHDFEDK